MIEFEDMNAKCQALETDIELAKGAYHTCNWDKITEITGVTISVFYDGGCSNADIPEEIIKKYESILKAMAEETRSFYLQEYDKIQIRQDQKVI